MKVIPENILKCMSPEARRKYGQRTAAEVMASGEATSEKQLQRSIVGLLRLKGIEVNVSAMHKRTTHRVGWPDLTFSVWVDGLLMGVLPGTRIPMACLWEVKMPQCELSPEQEDMKEKLDDGPNAWRHRVIRSVDQALAELKEMGIQ